MTYLTVPEVAERLRLSRMTVYRLIDAQKITSLKVGRNVRVLAEDLEHYISANTQHMEEAQ